MGNTRDNRSSQNSTMYYNQMVRDSRVPKRGTKKIEKVKAKSFGSQKIDFRNIVFAPEGYESIFYTIYFFTIPYVVGLIFIFLFVAGATYENFMLLDMKSFFIVWAIGYEVVAAMSLTYIAYLYVTYISEESKKKTTRRRRN
jgi:hypothetical protein